MYWRTNANNIAARAQLLFHRNRRKLWVLAIACLLLLFTFFLLVDEQDAVDITAYAHLLNDGNNSDSDTCKIPVLNPWDESILKYVPEQRELKCRRIYPPLVFLRDLHLYLNQSAFDETGYSPDAISCKRRCFDREPDDFHNQYDEWQEFQNASRLECEFVEVDCRRKGLSPLSVYHHFHAQLIPKASTVKNASQHERFSVSLFVLDSVSHSQWRRALPRTLNALQSRYNSTIMTAFNKVGDNSFPNAIAFLMGQRSIDQKLKTEAGHEDFDNWPLIWKAFEKQDYATFYSEDLPEFNLFTYLSRGFTKKPVDHYFRPYFMEAYASFVHMRSSYMCYDERPKYAIQLDYYRELLQKYERERRPTFALFWNVELNHEYMHWLSTADRDLERMLEEEESRLRDSFFFMFSDHGHRYAAIRQTLVGRLEDRMPFFSFHVPSKLLERLPELRSILDANSKKLASPFDLHATLRDILDLQERNAWPELLDREQPIGRLRQFSLHGLSLLRPLPERTCQEAGIPNEFCICQRERPVNTSEPIVRRAAQQLVKHTNELLKPFANKCAVLTLSRLLDARVSAPSRRVLKTEEGARSRLLPVGLGGYNNGASNGNHLNYAVTIEVRPSGAVLEATARHNFADDSMQIVGEVDRVNRYGKQSACIREAVARKYCFCV